MPIVFHRGPIKPLKSKPKDGETLVPKSLDNRHPVVRGLSQAAHALGMPTVRRSSSVTTSPRAAAPARRDIGTAPPGACLDTAPPLSTIPETMDLEANIAYLRSHPEVVADVERNIEDLRRVHGRMVRRTEGEIFVKPELQAMLDDLQGVVLLHGVLTYEKSLLSRVLCPRLRIHDPGQGGSLRLEQFDFEPGGADTHWPDTPSTVVAINGNNDEASVRWLAGELRRTPNVTVVTSGYGGYGIKGGFPVQTNKTEADRFAEILKEEGVTATILKERYATHSNQNAENVGALLKARGVSPDWVVCFGTPEAVGRQTRSYVKFMGRDPAKGATFVSGPRAPNERRDSVTDPLFSLRECATLLSLSHNTDFFPSGRDFGSPADYQDGMLKSGRAAGEALLSFSKMLVQHLEEGRLPSERVTSHLFSDPSDKAAGTFTLEALARSWIAFSQSPGWQALGDGDHVLPAADRRMLRRTQVVLGELFSAREDGFDRD